MKNFLLALGFSLICASSQIDPVDVPGWVNLGVTGDWHTILVGADDLEKISEYGEMRFQYRHLDCSDGGNKIDFLLYSKSNGECQKFLVRSSKGPHDIYEAKYKGQNFFKVEFFSDGVIVFYNINVDGDGKVTHMTVLAAQEDNLSEDVQKKFEELTVENNIPKENIRNVIETDNCPDV